MGAGFLEAVYQECLAMEFKARVIPFVASPSYQLDFVCFEKIIVELKAVREFIGRRSSTIFAPQA
jgi:GxxExxY protein